MHGRVARQGRHLFVSGLLASAVAVALPGPSLAAGAVNLAPQQLLLLHPPLEEVRPAPGTVLQLDYASIYVQEDSSSRGSVLLDLEVARLAVRQTWRLGPAASVSGELPLLWTGAGFFDSWFVAFHDAVGLPDGSREDAPRNRYRYEVTRGDRTYRPDGNGRFSLGDATVEAQLALSASVALRGTVKMPTGRPHLGSGSGHWDEAAGILWGQAFGRWATARLGVDVVHLGGTADRALRLATPWAVSAAAAGSVAALFGTTLELQVDYYATPYDTGLRPIDRDELMLTVGLARRQEAGWRWLVGFTEDLASESSPDFGLVLRLELPWES